MIDLRLGDCLEVMKTIPDGSVDAVITDPPYGIGESGKRNSTRSNMAQVKNYGNYNWDSKLQREHIDMMIALAPEMVIFGGNYYANWLPPSSSWIVWDKQNTGDFADCELAWTSHQRAIRIFRYRWNGFIKQHPEERHHPTQKPLVLMQWIIENYTKPGCTVIDPFMGSGTTGVACVKTGRNFIGIEICEQYFEIAKRRIEEAQLQIPLAMS